MQDEGGENRRFKGFRGKKLTKKAIATTDDQNFLSLYCQNISGAKSKITTINERLSISLFQLVLFQETWFDRKISDEELIKNTDFNIYRHDREQTDHHKQIGGGVATLVRSHIKTKRHVHNNIRILQYICLELSVEQSVIFVINIYYPFGFSREANVEFELLLRMIEPMHKNETIVMGDFNMPSVKWIPDIDLPGVYLPLASRTDVPFTELFFEFDLKQIAAPPYNRNHLDLAFVNDEQNSHITYPLEEELLDRASFRHSPFILNYQTETLVTEKTTYLNFGRVNLNKSKRELVGKNFTLATDEDAMLEVWHDNLRATNMINSSIETIKRVLIRNTPIKKVAKNWRSKHPWLRGSAIYEESLEFKVKAKKHYLEDPTETNKEIYKRASISNAGIFDSERTKFLNKMMDETKGNTFEFYSMIKSCNNTRKDTPETMLYKGQYLKGTAKLNAIAKQLGSCFLQNPPSLGDSFEDINERLLEIYHENYSDVNIETWRDFILNVSTEEISKMISELKTSKDPGPMNIPAIFLQFNSEIVAPIIQNAINTIFQTGRIPTEWKCSFITPIPKKGSSIDVENYRGIAMQSCIPKILDKVLTRILYERVGDILTPNQHGFRKKKGTVTNLLEITQIIHDNKKDAQIDVVYFDYSKAFDQIRHDILAVKLSKMGLPFNLYRTIMNFVIGRIYKLKVDGVEYDITITPQSSVPQGSHIGPLLYIIFTNDLGLDELTYADDTKLFMIIRNLLDRNVLQQKINRLESWSAENGLTLNPTKTYHVSYGLRLVHSLYFLKNSIIAEVDSVRDLGIIFDKELTFKLHIEHIVKRTQQMIGAARRFVVGIKKRMLITRIYQTYIQPIAEYGSVIWNQNRITLNNPLQLAHKKVTRIALNIYYNMSANAYIPYEKRCEILNQDGPDIRRITQAAVLGVKILKGDILMSFSNVMTGHINTNLNVRIPRLLNRTDVGIPAKSPLALLLASVGAYQQIINLSLQTLTIIKKIKEKNLNNRATRAAARGSIRLRV